MFAPGPASAQAPAGDAAVSAIRVEGAQRIEVETVRSYLTFRRGDVVGDAELSESLKKLFATGLFADVTLRRDGSDVVVRVVENPSINRLAFEGNNRISDEILQGEVQLQPRKVFTRALAQADTQRIIDIYRRSGRFAVRVEPKAIQLERNRIDLVFEITEGSLTNIRKISFIGNDEFSDRTLRGVIRTKEAAFYRLFSTDDTYDPDRLTFDRELLRRYYLSNGYADFRVVSVTAELSEDRQGFFVTFMIEEGERYRFGPIDVSTRLRELDLEQLRAELTVAADEWYDADAVEETIGNLTDAAGSAGYAFVDVRPRIDRDRDGRLIGITFDIGEGPRVFVERIEIEGNLRTEDDVIRREFLVVEGDAFNTAKLRRSRQRIGNLGFFEKVEIENVPGSTPDKTIVDVTVAERATGELSLGAGYSTTSGAVGDIQIRERNLLGKGQDLRSRLVIGERAQEIDLSFTEPYFLDKSLSAGFDVFRITRDLQRESSFDRTSTGGALRAGYPITERLTQRWRYRISEDEITGVPANASRAIKQQQGASITSSIGHTLIYDERDNRFLPTEGFFVELSDEVAGVGGDVRYFKNELRGAVYYGLTEDLIASARAGTGYIVGIGQDVRIIDRFFLGGASLRGFEPAGVGPRDFDTDDALGGKWYYRGSFELTFPLGLPDELGIRGRAFADLGSVGGVDGSIGKPSDVGSVRASVGVGIGWQTALGPIALDFGRAVLKESFDKTQVFRFSLGTRF